jgi:tetratricopeptide (TPR) repeat protein
MLDQRLEHLLKHCTVKIEAHNVTGTGFFVAPQLVLTCVHVVQQALLDSVSLVWQGQEDTISAEVESFNKTLDIALLRINEDTLDQHPCVWLDSQLKIGDACYSYGYPEDYPHGDAATFEYEGDSRTESTWLLKVKGGQANFGASGSPLVNLRTGGVIGMLSLSRNPNTDLGARAIPAEIMLSKLPDLHDLQTAFHQPGTLWLSLVADIRQAEERRVRAEQVVAILSQMESIEVKQVSASLITVPPKADHWQGRSIEVAQIGEWLSDPLISLIGIQGISGVGKSTLAARIFLQAENLEFPFASKFWADVSQQPDFVVFAEQALRSLGSKDALDIREVTQITNELINCLNDKRCLLVVDNLETLLTDERRWQDEAYEEFFRRWQQQGRTSIVLATTQEKPAALQTNTWLSLQGLGTETGEELLKALGVAGNAEELRTFADSLDGHPLTLKLVAGFLQEYCHGQLAQAKELGLDAFDQIVDAAAGQHRNNREVRRVWILQQHLERLEESLRGFLFDLSVYRQVFDLQAAAAMYIEETAETPLLEVKQALQELVNRSLLIELDGNKYQFQPFVANYIRQKVDEHTLGHSKAIEYWQRICVDVHEWKSLQDLTPNLEISYHQLRRQEWAAAADSLLACCEFLLRRGHSNLLIELARPLIDEFDKQETLTIEEERTLAVTCGYLAEALNNISEYRQSLTYAEKQLQIAQKIQDIYLEASTFAGIGESQYYLGQVRDALESHQKSLDLSQEIDDTKVKIRALLGVSSSYWDLGDWQRALDANKQAFSLAESCDSLSLQAKALDRLGIKEIAVGLVEQGFAKCEQALEIAREIGDGRTEIKVLHSLSWQRKEADSLQKAHNYLKEALRLSRTLQDSYQEICVLLRMFDLHTEIPVVDDLKNHLQNALNLSQKIGARQVEASALRALGDFSITQNETQMGLELLGKALQISPRYGV